MRDCCCFQQFLLILGTTASGEATLATVGLTHESVSEHPIAWLGCPEKLWVLYPGSGPDWLDKTLNNLVHWKLSLPVARGWN